MTQGKSAIKTPAESKPDPKGRIVIISAPSGTGKSTLCKALMKRLGFLRFSVSHTSRRPRPHESHGREYFFVSEDTFKDMVEKDQMAEWAQVHRALYGTSAAHLQDLLDQGYTALLDIDVQGARQIRKKFPNALSIFIMPPSMEALRSRLLKRGTENPEELDRRLERAAAEMAEKENYDHVVVNDDLDTAIEELERILIRQ